MSKVWTSVFSDVFNKDTNSSSVLTLVDFPPSAPKVTLTGDLHFYKTNGRLSKCTNLQKVI